MLDPELVIINLIFTGEKSPVEYYPTPVTLFLQLAYYAIVSFPITSVSQQELLFVRDIWTILNFYG